MFIIDKNQSFFFFVISESIQYTHPNIRNIHTLSTFSYFPFFSIAHVKSILNDYGFSGTILFKVAKCQILTAKEVGLAIFKDPGSNCYPGLVYLRKRTHIKLYLASNPLFFNAKGGVERYAAYSIFTSKILPRYPVCKR